MRIGLNLLHLHEGIGGVWNYVENLISALGRQDKSNIFVVFVTSHSLCLVPEQKNFIPVVIAVSPLNKVSRIFFEHTFLHYLGKKFRIDCMHWFANVVSPFCLVPCLVTIHDLLPLRHPEAYSLIKRQYLRFMFRVTARRAGSILAISRTTAGDIHRCLKPKTKQIHVVPVILDQRFKPVSMRRVAAFRKKYSLPEKFWLYVANFYPHKNHLALIQAYAGLREKQIQPWPLVLRGDTGPDTGDTLQCICREIDRLGITSDVIFPGRLAYGELPLLYASASALVFASLFEGGGIPVIESMACGCPVAASDIPVVKEFAGDAALLFDGTCVSAMENAMAELQKDVILQKRLRDKGFVTAGHFSGKVTIQKLLTAYKRVVRQSFEKQ